MKECKEHFDRLYPLECYFESPDFVGENLFLRFTGLRLLGHHPFYENGINPVTGVFIFYEVIDSNRLFSEYVGDPRMPDDNKELDLIIDVSTSPKPHEIYKLYQFEGYLKDPFGMFSWTVVSRSFALHLD